MSNYIVYDNDGYLIRYGKCLPEDLLLQADENQTVIEVEDFNPGTVNYPAKFNINTMQWEDLRDLEYFKNEKYNEIKLIRSSIEYDKFTWDGSDFDADSASQARLQGAFQLARIAIETSSPFSIDWTLYDNSVRTLSATDILGVGEALGMHVLSTHSIARTLKNQVLAATTIAEVEAVVWP